MADLTDFVRESNRIEGVLRNPTSAEICATADFLALPKLTVGATARLVSVYQPGACLRDRPGLDVFVGDHAPPRGGPDIAKNLHLLLEAINNKKIGSFEAHFRYESLHPFTDGNGRSGRAIWLWQRCGEAPLGFLHHWYYQSLSSPLS